MGMKAGGSGGMALAMTQVERVLAKLDAIEQRIKDLTDFWQAKHYFELETSFAVKAEENSKSISEQIPQGYIFIPQRIAVTAPEGSRLKIFSGQESGSNFLEVITNVQEYSEAILGPWVVFGPTKLLFVIEKAKVAGTCTLTLSGSLVKRDLVSHLP